MFALDILCKVEVERLAINVARAPGLAALRRAFTQENLRWLCHECHRGKMRFDRRLARYLRSCSMDWNMALMVWRTNRDWVGEFLGPFEIVPLVDTISVNADFQSAA